MEKPTIRPNVWAYLIAGALVIGSYSLFGWWGFGAVMLPFIALHVRDRIKKGYWT